MLVTKHKKSGQPVDTRLDTELFKMVDFVRTVSAYLRAGQFLLHFFAILLPPECARLR